MSEIKVNKLTPRTACGTTTLGDSGDSFTIPSGVTITNNGTQVGFGRTGTVDWITTPKVTGDSPVTGVTGKGYFLNTTAGTITFNLPAGTAGDIVSLADYAATWQTYNVTVSPNGTDKIGSVNSSVDLKTVGQSVTFVYVDGVQGWVNTMDSTSNVRANDFIVATGGNTIVTCGDYKTHIFTGPGTFCVSAVAPTAPLNLVDYVVVAGGAGGTRGLAGGGGAGGFRIFSTAPGSNSPLNNSGASPNTEVTVTASPYPIVVGGGGTAGPTGGPGGASNGSTSTFSTVDSAGGGKGGSSGNGPGDVAGTAGGSGGGGDYNAGKTAGGAGNTPPVSPSQGSTGGAGTVAPSYAPGGGGGASAVGGPSTTGGDGSYIADPFIGPTAPTYGTPGPVGSTRYFAGGGGGSYTPSTNAGAGGAGGGGTRTPLASAATGGDGDTNTGGGSQGGGSPNFASGSGGSGIVMIRYKYQ